MDIWEGIDEKGVLLTTEDRVGSFRGKYGFLSNMHDCPVVYKGITYKCSESAYQAQRCAYENEAKQFIGLTGVQAKKLVKQVVPRPDWNAVKVGIMKEIVTAKFTQNPDLTKQLLATGDKVLAEGNYWHDSFWGVYNGRGENTLGKILMEVRSELRKEQVKIDEKEKTQNGEFVIAVTGHRPHMMFGYDWKNEGNKALSAQVARTLKETIEDARKKGYDRFRVVTGMALGSDQMFAASALRLAASEEYKGMVVVEAAVSFEGKRTRWTEPVRKIYDTLIISCNEVTVCSQGGYSSKAMQDRNEYMVDKANILLSVYDGKSNGGTKNCIAYAVKKGVPVKDIGLAHLLAEYRAFRSKPKRTLFSKGNSKDFEM